MATKHPKCDDVAAALTKHPFMDDIYHFLYSGRDMNKHSISGCFETSKNGSINMACNSFQKWMIWPSKSGSINMACNLASFHAFYNSTGMRAMKLTADLVLWTLIAAERHHMATPPYLQGSSPCTVNMACVTVLSSCEAVSHLGFHSWFSRKDFHGHPTSKCMTTPADYTYTASIVSRIFLNTPSLHAVDLDLALETFTCVCVSCKAFHTLSWEI